MIPECAECEAHWLPADEERWSAYLTDDEPPELALYCRECGEREFFGRPATFRGRLPGARTPSDLIELTLGGLEAQTWSMSVLKKIGGNYEDALERVRVPAYMIDRHGIIRWINPAAERIVGDVRGKQMTSVLAPEERRRGRELFTRNLLGPPQGSVNKGVFITAEGERITMEVSGLPLKSGGHVIGVFGQVKDVEETEPPTPHPSLTPRQAEVLRLLEEGHSTDRIASDLHLSAETVRNHIRGILRRLGVHSRLEAVALSRQDHLVPS